MNQYLKDIQRLQDLMDLKILDTPQEDYLDELAELTSIICQTPAALITFIDDKRQWYKAKYGIEATEVPIEETICQHTIVQDDILEFEDAREATELSDNPNIHNENGVRFYAGINLYSENGNAIGTLCTFDIVPQKLNDFQKDSLRIIAKQVMFHVNKQHENETLRNELKSLINDKIEFAEKQLKVQEQAYNNLYNAIEKSNAVIEFYPNGDIITVNDTFLDIFEYKREELLGQKNTILLDEEDKLNNQEFWESLRSGNYQSGKFKRLNKDGKVIWIQASYSPVLDHEGNLVKITKIAQDITAEIMKQERISEAKQLADELNVQKDAFIANMSHELRTPLNAILGFSDLLIQNEENTQKKQYLTAIKSASDSLLFLVNDILDLSKIESGIIDYDNGVFSVQNVVEDVFNILSLKAKQKEIEFTFLLSDEVPNYIFGDKNRLIQVLNNLLNNAIKFTNSGKVHLFVELNTTQKTNQLKFTISDTGIGIPEDKLENIFNRFTQAESSTSRVYGGTGLGLNISKLIIENQGGKIGVSSHVNFGSEFWFTLPFIVSQKEEKVSFSTDNKNLNQIEAAILVCEDNELNQLLLKSIFEHTKYQVDFAENGLVAVELLKRKNYDLILMDLQMPFLDGYETTKIIRNEMYLKMPIIALTAHSLLKEKEKCIALGMNDYLSKPFKTDELLYKISSLIHKKGKVLFNFDGLEEYIGTDPNLKKQMIELFVTSSRKDMKLLDEYITASNFKEAAQKIHKLKTSIGILNSDLNLAQSFESELNKGENIEKILKIQKTFTTFIAELQSELEDYLKHL